VNHVFIVGFMGSGKSTVGRLVAARLGLPFLDLDTEIVEREHADIATIFREQGEPAFRQLEHEALGSLVNMDPHVVACGGGVVVDDRNRVLLRALGRVVYLRVTAEEALARIGSAEGRPLLAGPDPLAAGRTLLAARERLYSCIADITVDTSGKTEDSVAVEVVSRLSPRRT
jgi:shikimate kinase